MCIYIYTLYIYIYIYCVYIYIHITTDYNKYYWLLPATRTDQAGRGAKTMP